MTAKLLVTRTRDPGVMFLKRGHASYLYRKSLIHLGFSMVA